MAELRKIEHEEQEEIGEPTVLKTAYDDGSDALSVATKLTLMSEMNPNFIADKRLWSWIEAALD